MFVKGKRVKVVTHMFDWAGIMFDDYGTVTNVYKGRIEVQLDNGPVFLFSLNEIAPL